MVPVNYRPFFNNSGINQIFDIQFEEICLTPDETIGRLCEFLKMELTQSCQNYLDEQINTKKVGQYKENDPALVKEVEERIFSTLKKYRYL